MNLIITLAQGVGTVQGQLGYQLPSLTDVLTFIVRFFFVAGGIAALIYLLLGAIAWITSGGNKENVQKARDKILAALVGVVLIVVVVSGIAIFEQQVFSGKMCFGITCPLGVPELIQ